MKVLAQGIEQCDAAIELKVAIDAIHRESDRIHLLATSGGLGVSVLRVRGHEAMCRDCDAARQHAAARDGNTRESTHACVSSKSGWLLIACWPEGHLPTKRGAAGKAPAQSAGWLSNAPSRAKVIVCGRPIRRAEW
jgi:hypothetical protein